MKYQCLQLTNYDCGFACLKMILANFHHDENYLFLKQNLNKKNYSFLELTNIAKDHNLTLKGYEAMEKIADGKSTKLILPSELTNITSLTAAAVETINTIKNKEEKK